MILSAALVREYLELTSPGTSSKYSDGTIGSNIAAAQSWVERRTGRKLENAASVTMTFSTDGRTVVPLPGFRTVTAVAWNGTTLTADETYWLIPDAQQTGVYVGLQLRQFTGRSGPWWLGNPEWFDRGLDLPRRGGGGAPNDLVITGDAGYASNATIPAALVDAVKIRAAWLTLPDVVGERITIAEEAVAEWRISEQVVGVG